MKGSSRQTLTILIILVAAAVAVDAFLVEHHHVEFAWQRVPGHHGIIGLLAALGVILASRVIGEILGTEENTEKDPDA